MRTFLMLCGSNLFMTVAWYGHLKYKHLALPVVILVSWLIALPEYALQVPANRLGHGTFTASQLKMLQEAISVTAFVIFSLLYLREVPRWTDALGFVLVLAGLGVSLAGRTPGKAAVAETRSAIDATGQSK